MAALVARNLLSPISVSDSQLFSALAQNLAAHGCYSASPVEGGACVPSWGMQPPGYAVVLGGLRLLRLNGDRAVAVTQSLVFAAAVLYLAWALWRWHRDPWLFVATVTVPLWSPITFGSSRLVLTELLSGAAVLWVVAELTRSGQERRVRVGGLVLALWGGMLLRWDLIWLLPAVWVGLWMTFGWRAVRWPVMKVTALSAIPYLLLMARAVAVGLPALPSAAVGAGELPPGVLAFYRAGALDQHAAVDMFWPVLGREYAGVKRESLEMYAPGVDPGELRSALDALAAAPSGAAVPADVDQRFAALAARLQATPRVRFTVPFVRTWRIGSLWLGHHVQFSSLGTRQPLKAIFLLYGVLVVAGFLGAPVLARGLLTPVVGAAFLFVLGRTAFLVSPPISALETRYIDPYAPILEVVALTACWLWVSSRRHGDHAVGV